MIPLFYVLGVATPWILYKIASNYWMAALDHEFIDFAKGPLFRVYDEED